MARHGGLLGLPGVPEPGTEDFDAHARTWENVFRRLNSMDAEVERASLAVLENPPKWWVEQLPAIEAAILASRAANPARGEWPDDVPQAREDAERASRSCEMCSGSGWAEVFHRRYQGKPTIEDVNSDLSVTVTPARFRLACICPAGRWLLRAHERAAADAESQYERDRRHRELRTIQGIERVMQGHTDYQCGDPTYIEGVDMPGERTDWRAMVRAWAEAKGEVASC